MRHIYAIETKNDGTLHSAYRSLSDAQTNWDTLSEEHYEIVPYVCKDDISHEI